MSNLNYPIGSILVVNTGHYTKVISEKNGVYGLSGWASKQSAEKANVARKFINVHGLKYAGARIVSEGEEEAVVAPTETPDESPEKEVEEHSYSRTDLRKMKVDELYPLAESVGISTDDSNKSEVLEELYTHFEL